MPQDFGPRQHLIREGDTPGPVFAMLEGWAIRYKVLPGGSRQIMAILMPGDSCDLHMGMLEEMDHSIEAVTQSVVATIPRDVMDQIMAGHPTVARAMYVAQLIDEDTSRAWIVSMGRRNSIESTSHLLLELYIRAIRVGLIPSGVMEFPLTQAVIANALGATTVHINRVLQTLRHSGAIELRRGHLRIPDPAILVRLSGLNESYVQRRLPPQPFSRTNL